MEVTGRVVFLRLTLTLPEAEIFAAKAVSGSAKGILRVNVDEFSGVRSRRGEYYVQLCTYKRE